MAELVVRAPNFRGTPITDAVVRELMANEGRKLRKFAQVLVNKGLAGDMTAMREVLDRFEGRVKQQLEHTGAEGGPMVFARANLDSARRVAYLLAQATIQKARETTEPAKEPADAADQEG